MHQISRHRETQIFYETFLPSESIFSLMLILFPVFMKPVLPFLQVQKFNFFFKFSFRDDVPDTCK